jgi:hypothetical protein
MLTTLVALAALTSSAPIKLEPVGDQWIVRAVDAGESALSVTLDANDRELPSVLGSQTTQGRDRIFTPRFSFQPGMRYRAVVANRTPLVFEIPSTLEAPRIATQPRVAHVYPSAPVLPENQLKFYIEFATPMTRGDAYRRIRLLDADERPMAAPFLELDEELWDVRLQRFTLYFDPGRVKSDLVPNREVGSPLRSGQRYTLIVEAGWQDAQGNATTSAYRKSFAVGPRDEKSPNPSQWHVHAPAAGSLAPLTLEFTEPLEHALALRMIEVHDANNRALAGKAQLTHDETRWSFTPEQAWAGGRYFLVIDAMLEDLAGNKVSRPFEVAIRSDAERNAAPTSVSIPVDIGAMQ